MKTVSGFAIKALALTLIVISSCSKSSDKVISPLAGSSWKLTNETVADCSNPSDNHNTPCSSNCPIISFSSTTYTVTLNGAVEETGSYSVNGSQLTMTPSGGSAKANTFTLSGNTLTVVTPETGGCFKTASFLKQ